MEKSNYAKKKSFLRNLADNKAYFLMLLPGVVLLILFNYLPMFGSILAFKVTDYSKNIFELEWAGLSNFEFLFKNPDVFVVLRNTLAYNFMFILTGATVPVAFAIALSQLRNAKTARVYQSFMFLPYFLSWIIISYLAFALFDFKLGVLNSRFLKAIGAKSINWYQEPEYWPAILIFLNVWKTCGYNSVIYFAAIMGIDDSLYEAAAIDGAGKWKQIKIIVIPSIKPTIIMLAILAVGRIMNADFGLFYNVPMGSGALMPVTNVLDTFVYNALKLNGDVAMSAAAAFFQSIVGFVLVILTNYIVKKLDSTQALF